MITDSPNSEISANSEVIDSLGNSPNSDNRDATSRARRRSVTRPKRRKKKAHSFNTPSPKADCDISPSIETNSRITEIATIVQYESIRKERNRLAAQRMRDRRKKYLDTLLNELDCLKSDNSCLEKDIQKLDSERKKLECILLNHETVCKRSKTRCYQFPPRSRKCKSLISLSVPGATSPSKDGDHPPSHKTCTDKVISEYGCLSDEPLDLRVTPTTSDESPLDLRMTNHLHIPRDYQSQRTQISI